MPTPQPAPQAEITRLLANILNAQQIADLNAAIGVPIESAAGLSTGRYSLVWYAGSDGVPGINADVAVTTPLVVAEIATMLETSKLFEVTGTNGTSALCTRYAEGGLLLQTPAVDGECEALIPHADAGLSVWRGVTWGTDNEVEWECRIGTVANIADLAIMAGLKLTGATAVVGLDDDGAWFRYEDSANGGIWQCITNRSGVDTTHSLANVDAVAINTDYHLAIKINAAREPSFWINGTLVHTAAALDDATDLLPVVGVEADAAVAKQMRVYGQAISRAIGA